MDKKKIVMEKDKGIPYLNSYNMNIILRFLFISGWRSIFVWLLITVAFAVVGVVGVFVVLFVALTTIILKGIYKKMWMKYSTDNINKER